MFWKHGSGKHNTDSSVQFAEARLDVADHGVNAVPEELRFFELARQRAEALEPKLAHLRKHPDEVPRGYLWGLPILIKDLTMVKGVFLSAQASFYLRQEIFLPRAFPVPT